MADLEEVAADLRARHGRKMRVATKYVNLTRALLRRARHRRLPHRREPRRHRGRAGRRRGRADRRHHHHRRDAGRQRPQDPRRRRDAALRGQSRGLRPRAVDRRARGRGAAVLTRIAAEEEARTSREVRAALDPAGARRWHSSCRASAPRQPYGNAAGAKSCSIAGRSHFESWPRCRRWGRRTSRCGPSTICSGRPIP